MRWLRITALMGLVGLMLAVPQLKAGPPALWDIATPQSIDNDTHVDVNNIDMFVTNHGSFGWDLVTGDPGTTFPKGTDKTVIFASGLWMGAKVGNDLRVTVAEYSQEYAAGTINPDGTPASEVDPRFRVYKINRGDDASNPDWADWPVDDGAPVDGNGDPLILGDQTLWAVYNDADDDKHSNTAGNTTPLGVEVRQTVFAFDRQPPLGNMIFVKLQVLNRGGNQLDSTYVAVWSDPDLGGFTDDLVGCDTTLSLGYVYNATNDDELYGSTPPAVGYDFFQGPPNTYGIPFGDEVPATLPMTSFNKYINGTDPATARETYNYMRGLDLDGTPLMDPVTNEISTFFVPGDPVTGEGWLDDNPADRRFMLSAGPFQMMPGDTAEVVVGIIVAQGSDRLNSIQLLKQYDEQAQAVFDLDFLLPAPPPRPSLYVREYDEELDLVWGIEADGDVQISDELNEEYHFQGFNIYQGESVAGPWKKIFTFDVIDSIALIYNDIFDVGVGGSQRVIVQNGTNSGITHQMRIDQDFIRGGPLVNFKEYYFAVTAYSYEVRKLEPYFLGPNQVGVITAVLENSPVAVVAMPKSSAGVLEVTADHPEGLSDGAVEVAYVDQEAITGHTYEVTFRDNPDTNTVGDYPLVWDLTDVTDDVVVLEGQLEQTLDFDSPLVDGMILKVAGPASGWKENDKGNPMIDEIATADGVPVEPDGNGGPGNDVWHSLNSTGEWYVGAGGGDGGLGRFTRDGGDLASLDLRDVEMRWDNDPDNWGWWAFDGGEVAQIPFGLYLVDPFTGDSERMVPVFCSCGDEGSTAGVYDFEGVIDPYFEFPGTDFCYAYTIDTSIATYADFVQDAQDGAIDNDPTTDELFARMLIGSLNEPPTFPAEGTVIKFSTTKPNTVADVFRFKTYKPGESDPTVISNELADIRAVPNPYFNKSAYELNQFERVVRFINLPSTTATIRIFNLAGELIRTIEKDDPEVSWVRWDLQNEQAIPVASGIYIYHIEAQGIGTEVGKVAVFIEKERLDRF